MIFPSHCKFIGVINKHIRSGYKPNDAIYFSSQYVLVFEAPDRCEIYEVETSGDQGFIRKKTGARMLSSAAETVVYRDMVDISNRADLLRRAVPLCVNGVTTVVFQGIDRHYMFVKDPNPETLTSIEVYDVAPPDPAWLAHNVKKLEEAGMFGELMLSFDYHVLNLKDYEDPRRTVIFPCHASGLNGLFLDSLDEEPQGDIKLVGCNTSKLVFEARYPLKKHEHVNICPLSTRKPSRPFILRCCQSDKLGMTQINGVPGVVVHWGANPREIYEAVRELARSLKKQAD